MTAQKGDIYKYENKEYSIVALSGVGTFHPKDYGLESHPNATCCHRGYWCDYAIENEVLMLKDLYIFNRDDNYPSVNGIIVSPQEFQEYGIGEKDGSEKITIPKYFGHRVYKNINLPIHYTGAVLMGREFIWDYYIHMGFQRGWAYKILIELIFEDGVLVECNDVSQLARAMREKMGEEGRGAKYPFDENIQRYILESFSLDYSKKVWWFDEFDGLLW